MSRETIVVLSVFFIISVAVFKRKSLAVIKQYLYLYWKVDKSFAFQHPHRNCGRVQSLPCLSVRCISTWVDLEGKLVLRQLLLETNKQTPQAACPVPIAQ